MGGLEAVFAPQRVAVVGASPREGTLGNLLWRNLADFDGDVVPVTPRSTEIDGQPTHPSLRAVPGPVDLAVVAVPASAAVEVAEDAGAKGVGAMVVLSGGFAETGAEGRGRQEALVAAAHRGDVRVVGPNCLGVQNSQAGLNASMAAGRPREGRISLITQSGAYGMAIHTLGSEEGVGFAKVCAMGNQADVTSAEVLAYLGEDPATGVVCGFLESLADGRAFCEAARAVTPTKPVVVAKVGRSASGQRAAVSHTAALAGDSAVLAGAFHQAGVTQARSGLEMMDVARALASQPPPTGRRVAIVTNSGGTGVELTDLLADEHLTVPLLSPALQDELGTHLPAHGSPRNPVDITPVWDRFATLYPTVVECLARSGEVDVVVPVLLQRSALDEQVAHALCEAVNRLRAAGSRVPVYVCWVAPRTARPNAEALQAAGIPCFEWPERTARAIGQAVRWARPPAEPVAADDDAAPTGAISRPTAGDGTPSDGATVLDVAAGAALLTDAGVALAPSRTCATAEDAVAAAEEVGYPVVAKVAHPDIVHRSDAGGVATGLGDAAAVRAAATDLAGLAAGAQVLIQPELAGVEVVVGGLRDPQLGPTVMVGLGGVLVEVLGDTAFVLAPLTDADADAAWQRLRGRTVLDGARGGPSVDRATLARLTRQVGDVLMAHPEVVEIDLNPVIATADQAVAVDWHVRASPSDVRPSSAEETQR